MSTNSDGVANVNFSIKWATLDGDSSVAGKPLVVANSAGKAIGVAVIGLSAGAAAAAVPAKKEEPKKERNKKERKVYPGFLKSIDEVCADLSTSVETGISTDIVAGLNEKFGFNELAAPEQDSIWDMIVEQFDDLLVSCRRRRRRRPLAVRATVCSPSLSL